MHNLSEALAKILKARGEDNPTEIGDPNKRADEQLGTWLGDCAATLSAAIRDDAVWVNRSAAFDEITVGLDEKKARKDAHTLLSHILSDDFLSLPAVKEKTNGDGNADKNNEKEERQSALKATSKGAGNRTRHPFSHLLGEGKPFGKPPRKLILRDSWHAFIKPRLDALGIPVVDVKDKNRRKKGAAPAHTELQREMFSKAASRVAQIVTKQRQQEVDRLARRDADKELRKIENDESYKTPLSVLHKYCEEYGAATGTLGEFMIRPRQITGWDRVIKQWSKITETDPELAQHAN